MQVLHGFFKSEFQGYTDISIIERFDNKTVRGTFFTRSRSSSFEEAVRNMTGSRYIFFIARAASIPSVNPSRSISMRTASGFFSPANLIASSAVAAFPQTEYPRVLRRHSSTFWIISSSSTTRIFLPIIKTPVTLRVQVYSGIAIKT